VIDKTRRRCDFRVGVNRTRVDRIGGRIVVHLCMIMTCVYVYGYGLHTINARRITTFFGDFGFFLLKIDEIDRFIFRNKGLFVGIRATDSQLCVWREKSKF